jgi:hypothetical protein
MRFLLYALRGCLKTCHRARRAACSPVDTAAFIILKDGGGRGNGETRRDTKKPWKFLVTWRLGG